MTSQRLTFIDVDENLFVVWLKPDRVQLLAVDSRPELEAGELRAFATALFSTYAAAPLTARLDALHTTLLDMRHKLAASGSGDLVAALDDSLCTITDLKRGLTPRSATPATAPATAPVAAPADAPGTAPATAPGESVEPLGQPAPAMKEASIVALGSRRRKRTRGGTACEGTVLRWPLRMTAGR